MSNEAKSRQYLVLELPDVPRVTKKWLNLFVGRPLLEHAIGYSNSCTNLSQGWPTPNVIK